MINGVKRYIPENLKPFQSSDSFMNEKRVLIEQKKKQSDTVFLDSLEKAFDLFNIQSGSCLSFHHHLRNGDHVLQDVCKVIKERGLKNLHFAPSSIFPSYTNLVDLIMDGSVTDIHTNYINGPVAKAVSQ